MTKRSIGPLAGQLRRHGPAALQRPPQKLNPYLRRLRLEMLEDRRLLSVGALPMPLASPEQWGTDDLFADQPAPSAQNAETPPAQAESLLGESLLVNGSFETGDFTGWTARANGLSELTPWTVATAGSGFFFNSAPYEGSYSALNGFDGAAGLQYELFQDVAIPADRTRVLLTTHHRIIYTADGRGTQDRTLTISVRDTAGGLLETLHTEAIAPELAAETDLGWQANTFDLSAYAGQTVRVHFEETVPDAYTGPAMVELDDIRLEAVLAIDVGPMTTDLIEGASSTVGVRLSGPITSDVTVSVARTSGDEDITVSPATLLFTPANWHQTQSVVFFAAEDGDVLSDQATFTFTADGLPDETLDVVAIDKGYIVNTLADVVAVDGLLSLREALQAANTNAVANEAPAGSATEADRIQFDMPALQAEAGPGNVPTITLGGTQLSITDGVVIAGPGAEQLSIDAAGQSRVIFVGDGSEDTVIDVAISGLTVTGGMVDGELDGGGIHNDRETLELNGIAVQANSAFQGGGIYSYYGAVSINDSTLSDNSATNEGGGLYGIRGTISVTNSILSGNSASDDGAGVCCFHGSLTVSNSTVSDNSASDDGGGLYSYSGALSVSNSTLSGNSAIDSGGGIYGSGNNGTISVADSTLSGNSATGDGGGIRSNGNMLSVSNSTLLDNLSTGNGGGIYSNEGAASVINSTLLGNLADMAGGGIFSEFGTLSVTNSTLSGNSALDSGGGICSRYDTLLVTNSTLSGNSASLNGGGISSGASTLLVSNSMLSGNSAGLNGGGISGGAGMLSVSNSTLSGNLASGDGGGVYVYGDPANISNSIFWQNGGTELGGPAGVSVTSSLINVDPAFVRDPSDGGDGWGDDPATPGVDESANDDYGDLRLTDRSFAIGYGDLSVMPLDSEDLDQDGVTDEPIPFDLDGNPRVFGGSVDCGAYEYQHAITHREAPSVVVTTATDVCDPHDNQTSLREAIYYAGTTDLVAAVAFDPALDGAVITLVSGALIVSSSLTIDASLLTSLTVDAGGRSRALVVAADDVVLESLTISGGHSHYGAGVYSAGTLSVINSTLSGNSATYQGGGIYSYNGTLSVTNSTLLGNSAVDNGGGIYINNGTLSVVNSTLSGNLASWDGGGIYGYEGTVSVVDATLSGNSAGWGGGGIYSYEATLSVINSTLSGNSASGGGGVFNAYGTLLVANSTLSDNSADKGGGIYSLHDTLSVTDSTLSGNSAGTHGGGFFSHKGTLSIVNSTLSRNSAGSQGGGIYNDAATLSVANAALSGNSANSDGGGIHADHGALSVTNSTLSGNSTSSDGGGIYSSNGTLSVTNSTLSSNSASSEGGAIYRISDGADISNSIVWQNGVVHIGGSGYSGTSNLIGIDPSFVRNPSDGGDGWGDDPATPGVDESANDDFGDLRLQLGSAAIDAGDNAALPLDELDLDGDGIVDEPLPIDLFGIRRIVGGTVDIGAYEYFVPATVAGRHLFYNNSRFDGKDAGVGAADDAAIASDKQPLLPGDAAEFANYTSYSRGINGLMIDISELPGTPGSSEFEFRVGNGNQPGTWQTAPAPSGITVRHGEGAGGSDRVTLVWPDGAIRNTWLQVVVKATPNTGLAAADVFYYGNAVGETGNSTTDAMVTSADEIAARQHPQIFTPAGIDNLYDFDRDGMVSAVDQIIARRSVAVFDALELIDLAAPMPAPLGPDDTGTSASPAAMVRFTHPTDFCWANDESEEDEPLSEEAVDRLLATIL